MTIHNYFFYFKQEMPWKVKDAIQDKGKKRSGKKGQKVESAKEAQNEKRSDSASESA